MSYTRETARDALASLLSAALVGTGLPAQAFYGYPVADFQSQSPVVVLRSAGSERTMETMSTRRKSFLHYDIISFTLYADAASSWTEANAEDKLDAIEQVVDETLAANLVNGTTWADIGYDGKSTTGNVTIGGEQFRFELIPIIITVFHD
jgi:hypothetical protein